VAGVAEERRLTVAPGVDSAMGVRRSSLASSAPEMRLLRTLRFEEEPDKQERCRYSSDREEDFAIHGA